MIEITVTVTRLERTGMLAWITLATDVLSKERRRRELDCLAVIKGERGGW